jgi:hypothetical protein
MRLNVDALVQQAKEASATGAWYRMCVFQQQLCIASRRLAFVRPSVVAAACVVIARNVALSSHHIPSTPQGILSEELPAPAGYAFGKYTQFQTVLHNNICIPSALQASYRKSCHPQQALHSASTLSGLHSAPALTL